MIDGGRGLWVAHPKVPRVARSVSFGWGQAIMAGEPGFEPGPAESESAVLPLDDSPKFKVESAWGFRCRTSRCAGDDSTMDG